MFLPEHGCRKSRGADSSDAISSTSCPRNTTFSSSIRSMFHGASLGEHVTQSTSGGTVFVPFVSICTKNPRSFIARKRSLSSCKRGSPPVQTRCREGNSEIFDTISSAVISSKRSCAVSQKLHLRLQPAKRKNTAAVPVKYPSP